uniref:tRNA:m(4)X modification enzyme TRM13 n=1 Tax=Romanomermis culicivorax TaxID=13658 RepID=A0A915K6H6_ROMCU
MEFLRCQYVIVRKKRSCKMLVKNGEKFCAEHIIYDQENQGGHSPSERRIPCPLDPKHTVAAGNLKKHLKACNSRLRICDDNPWIVENFNVDDTKEFDYSNFFHNLQTIDMDNLLNLFGRIDRAWSTIFDSVSNTCLIRVCFPYAVLYSHVNELELATAGKVARKHLIQQYAIADLLKKFHFVWPNTCFVEYGAGKAKLSYELGKLFNEKCRFLLIEKCGLRGKAENKIKIDNTDCSNCDFTRIRCAIEHLDLRKHPIFKSPDQPNFVPICKHLCGSAFDFTINSIINCFRKPDDLHLLGAVLIPCCHHRCLYSQFRGRTIFEEFGFSPNDFKVMAQMSSWAVCKFRNNVATENCLPDDRLNAVDKEKIGEKCKFIFDFCRGRYLEEKLRFYDKSYNVAFKRFVDSNVTPENLALIVEKNE